MSAFASIGRDSARAILQTTGESVLYRGASGDIRTLAQVDTDVDYVGGDSRMSDRRHVCLLLAEDVADPQKRDEIHTDSGVVWILREPLPTSDDWFHEWTVTPK